MIQKLSTFLTTHIAFELDYLNIVLSIMQPMRETLNAYFNASACVLYTVLYQFLLSIYDSNESIYILSVHEINILISCTENQKKIMEVLDELELFVDKKVILAKKNSVDLPHRGVNTSFFNRIRFPTKVLNLRS
jgi:hypothetical protein